MSEYSHEPSWQQEYTNSYAITDPLSVIYNENQWRLYQVSPMQNLKNSSVKLKQYRTKIRDAIASTINMNPSVAYKVEIATNPYLKYCEDDADALMISVLIKPNKNKSKIAYACILLSWGISIKLEEAVHLPYMLERGEQRLGAVVKTTLQSMFDCNIHQLNFTQFQLLQFGFSLIEDDTSKKTDPFVLSYTSPQLNIKDKLHLSLEIGDVHIIWNGVQKEVNDTSELVQMAYKTLQSQILYTVKLDTSILDLCVVTLPKAEVKQDGVVKMKTSTSVNSILTVLNEICFAGQCRYKKML